jgi:hypothetical protein
MPSPNRISAIEIAPMFIAMALTMGSLLIVPHIGPQRLVADRFRFYTIAAAASLLLVIVIGVVAVRTMAAQRVFLLFATLASLPFVPFAVTPVIEWFNARFDRSAASSVVYQVRGYVSNGRNLVSVRLKRISEPSAHEFTVGNKYPFFDPLPPEGTVLRGDLHRGVLGVGWISALATEKQTTE